MVWDQKALTVVMVNNEEKENPVRQVQIVGENSLKSDVSLEKSRQGSLTSPRPYSEKRQLNSQPRENTFYHSL